MAIASTNSTYLTKNLADAYFGGTYKMMLVSVDPTEAQLDQQFRSGVTNEVTGTGYTASGATITMTVGAIDTTNNRVGVTLGAVSWPASTITAVGGWVYKNIGTAATDQLVTYVDFGGAKASSGGAFDFTASTPLYINR